ncbi:Poly(ADP-ribose) polymerase catalytic domain [Trinorchestia longiramus]|nr:Poly(ADP-ribose) polymerase catalytic domain [Trinorchestia longiramus]
MSNRGSRASQSMCNLSDMSTKSAHGRRRGRGLGRGYERLQHPPRPLLEHPVPHHDSPHFCHPHSQPRHPHPHPRHPYSQPRHPHSQPRHPHSQPRHPHPHPRHPYSQPRHPYPHGPPNVGHGGTSWDPDAPGNHPHGPVNHPHGPVNHPHGPVNHPHGPGNHPHAPGNDPHAAGNYPHAPGNHPHASGYYPYTPDNYPNAHGNFPNAAGNYQSASANYPNAPWHDYPSAPNMQPSAQGSQQQEFSSKQTEKKGSGSTSFLNVKDLLQALIQAPHQKLSSETILNKFQCSEKALDTVCAHNKKLISVSAMEYGMDVDLIPNMKICGKYLGSEGCMMSTHCGKFHICKAFASGDCPENAMCEFGHIWKTNHNKKLFEEMMLDSFAETLLKNLMKKVVLRTVGISLCKSYNEGTCRTGKQCNALHICQKLLEGSGKCENETCTLNHDILEPKCSSLLTIAGIDTNDSKRDVLTKVKKLVQPDQSIDKKELKPDDEAIVKKLDCFQALDEQELVVTRVVRLLLVSFNYWSFLDNVLERLEIIESDLLELLRLYRRTFLVHESDTRTFIKLQPKIDLCSHYKAMKNCYAGKACNFLHLCHDFVTGNCNNSKCTRLHRLNTSPNDKILKRHFLLNVPENLVLHYLRKRFQLGSLPYICFPYNNGNCSKGNCEQLHVCYDVLFTLKTCYQQNCDKNHDVMSSHNRKLLSSVKDAGDDAIKTALCARVPMIRKTADVFLSSKQLEITKFKQKGTPGEYNKNSESEHSTEQSGSIENISHKSTAKSSHRLDGDVIVPEICVDHLQDTCRPATNMCPKLHARVAYHWQFSLNGTWHNFAFPHSNHLENQYRDISQTSADLSPLEYGRTPLEKRTYSFMKDKGLAVDFDKMELSSSESPTVAVRRIGTSSSAITSNNYATVFGWFFEDKNKIWIEYGNIDSTGFETHSTTMTSVDIEKAYSANEPNLKLSTDKFTYTIDFLNMNQTNDQTLVVRPVLRRPKHVLIEKLQPSDPYGLKKAKNNPASIDAAKPPVTVKKEDATDGKYPSFWAKMDGTGPKCYSVDLSSAEGSELARSILLSMPSAEIQGIRRLQNTFHYNFFETQMKRHTAMTKKPVLNIQRLFHGTREEHVPSISKMNFEWRQEYADSGQEFGRGAYFFNNAALAHQFASNLAGEDSSSPVVIAVADVYVGTVALGNSTMTRPPLDASGALTDTTVDNLKVPSIFVKYNSKEYCPHYFINLKV